MSNLKRDIEGVLKQTAKFEPAIDGSYIRAYFTEKATTQIINLIESVIDKVIGEDEVEFLYGADEAPSRNQLRAEQRDIKSKLIDGERK